MCNWVPNQRDPKKIQLNSFNGITLVFFAWSNWYSRKLSMSFKLSCLDRDVWLIPCGINIENCSPKWNSNKLMHLVMQIELTQVILMSWLNLIRSSTIIFACVRIRQHFYWGSGSRRCEGHKLKKISFPVNN